MVAIRCIFSLWLVRSSKRSRRPHSHHRFIIYEIVPTTSLNRSRTETRIEMIDMMDFEKARGQGTSDTSKKGVLEGLGRESWRLLGSFRDRVVFLDHGKWVCTYKVGSETGSIRRHFFFPQDWVNDTTVLLLTLQGTLLCARNGEVAIVRYLKGF